MGGMQVLEWAIMFPDRVRVARPDRHVRRGDGAADRLVEHRSPRHPLDPSWRGGDYYDAAPGDGPHEGLAMARMISQITFRSDDVFTDRFGREVVEPLDGGFSLWQRFEVERYLEYHGDKLVRRFDANSYLLLTKAMDLHDLGRGRGGARGRARRASRRRCSRWASAPTCSIPPTSSARSSTAVERGRRRRRLRRARQPPRPRRLPDRARPGRRGRDRVPRRESRRTMADQRRVAPRDRGRSEPAARTTTRSLAPVLWPSTTYFNRSVDENCAHRHDPRTRASSTAATAARRCSSSRTPSPRSKARRRRWRSGRAWARSPRSCSRSARPATTSSPSADVLGDQPAVHHAVPPLRHRRHVRRRAPTPTRSPPRCGRARRSSCSSRRRPTRGSMLVDLDAVGAIAGTVHGVRRDVRTAAGAADAVARRRPRHARGHEGHRRPQRRHARRRRRRARPHRRGVGASPDARRGVLARSTRGTPSAASARCTRGPSAVGRARSARRVPRSAPGGSQRVSTRGSTRTRSARSPSAR